MPTLMSRATFDDLSKARKSIVTTLDVKDEPSNVFVPWAGSQILETKRGIYYVGIATDAEAPDDEQTFDACLRSTEEFCDRPSRGWTPYWQFLNRLSNALLGGPYDQTQARWGWSNLLKIAGNTGAPNNWPGPLVEGQRDASKSAFREEMNGLRDSLIVITSADGYGILYETIADESNWDRDEREGRTYWLHDPNSGNIFVHCYHPKFMQTQGFFDAAADEVVRIARGSLAPF